MQKRNKAASTLAGASSWGLGSDALNWRLGAVMPVLHAHERAIERTATGRKRAGCIEKMSLQPVRVGFGFAVRAQWAFANPDTYELLQSMFPGAVTKAEVRGRIGLYRSTCNCVRVVV